MLKPFDGNPIRQIAGLTALPRIKAFLPVQNYLNRNDKKA